MNFNSFNKALIPLLLMMTPFRSLDKEKIKHATYNEEKPKINFGIDISHYQTKINYDSLVVDFVIIKKSEGITISDNLFNKHFNNIKKPKTAYHFFRPECDGVEQANFFLKNLNLNELTIIPVVDVEMCSTWGRYKKTGIKNLNKFINHIEDSIGCKPIIYTSPNFWNQYVDTNFNCLLWVADYREFDDPEIPCGFSDWVIWQKTNKHHIKSIDGFVDFNVCKDFDLILY